MSAIDVYQSWIEAITSLPVVQEDEDDPTVPRPSVADDVATYVLIGWDSDDAEATTTEQTTDTPAAGGKVEYHRTELLTGRLAVDIYGPGSTDYVRALRSSLTHPTTLALLLAAGDYGIRKAGPVLSEPILRSATREPHASAVFDVAWSETTITAVDYADTVETTTSVDEETE